MSVLKKALLLSLLVVLLSSQAVSPQNALYQHNGQTFTYIYGSGSSSGSAVGRASTQPSAFTPDSSYVPPAKGPAPVNITCPINQVYDNVLCQCVCVVGYFLANNTCVAHSNVIPICARNQVYQNSRCVCAIGFFLIGSVCDVCPPYSTYNLSSTSCVCAQGYLLVDGECRSPYVVPPQPPLVPLVCSINQQIVGGICVCLKDFYIVKGVCTYCISPNYYDPQLALCRPTCTLNQTYDLSSNLCLCNGGYYNIKGQCAQCPFYSVYNKVLSQCDCVPGYTFNSGVCIPLTTPPVRPELPVPPSECPDSNAVFIEGQGCICTINYHKINGICQQCPVDYFYDADLGICRTACLANEVFNIITSLCDCAPEHFRINGTCTKCKGNSTFNPLTNLCSCPSGYRQAANGSCLLGCGINQILNNGICCCIEGFYPVAGICGKCEWNQVYDQGLGICRIPCDSKRIFDISKQACVCLPQFFEMLDGLCGICPVNSHYSAITKTCVCNNGFIMNLGLCTSACNAFEEWINGSCQCKLGYYLIGYSCGVCPPGQIYDKTYRICRLPCKTNQVWDPTIRACRCLPSYYLVSGVCSQCNPLTQVYNQKNQCCECISGYKKAAGQGCNGVCIPICTENEDWIKNRCVCKPGYYLINNFCTQCPAGQSYDVYQRICRVQCGTNQIYNFNTGKCDCAQHYYLIQGICSKCPPNYTYDEYKQECALVPCQGANQFYSPSTQTCVCLPQYVRIKGVCTNCNPGYFYDAYSDRCLCKPGFIDKGGFCDPICPLDQTYVNGKCQCNNGLPLHKGKCVAPIICPLNSHLDRSSGCCVCNPGFSVIAGKCSNYQYCGLNGNLVYGQCSCNPGFFWINGACRPCAPNQGFNGLSCECYLGYSPDSKGNCVQSNFQPTCYQNQRYDSALKACVCIQNTQYIRGRCITIPTCPPNSFYNSVTCVCHSGYELLNGNCNLINTNIPTCPANSFFNGVACSCNTGFYQSDINACAACPAGTTYDGLLCNTLPPKTCAAGFTHNNISNQCQPLAPSCGQNAYFNGACCVCTTGHHLINHICQQCPAGFAFDGAKCSLTNLPAHCKSNEVLVNGKCVCNEEFYLINGQCLKCPPYTKWNGRFCDCNCDSPSWCFGKPFTQYDKATKTCKCKTGYLLVNGVCSQ